MFQGNKELSDQALQDGRRTRLRITKTCVNFSCSAYYCFEVLEVIQREKEDETVEMKKEYDEKLIIPKTDRI